MAYRLRSKSPTTKVLYMSGYTDAAIPEREDPDSVTEFIPKPFMPDALTRQVRQMLDR